MSGLTKTSFYLRFGKRGLDLFGSALGLLVLLPVFAVIALAVRLSSDGPAWFSQIRIGRFGRPFKLVKFRTMRVGSEKGSQLTAAGDARITPLGAWLRRTKLDELPQLWNVLRGDMSLVGPRPEVPRFVTQYTDRQRGVLNARPGMTGPGINLHEEELLASQANKEEFYVNKVLPAKLENDLGYIADMRFSSDIGVLLQTFKKVSTRFHEPYMAPSHRANTNLEIQSARK
jgi:lipopolysaccharide/colanic/teichoic acid biosynthesis glycosyltransferase